jgi:hypothetical protein
MAANQEVEATGYLYEMKKVLSQQCTYNFRGLTPNDRTNQILLIKELIEYEDGSSLEAKRFSRDEPLLKGSKTGLSIASYTLSSRSLKRRSFPGRGFFIVRFKRKENSRALIKQIPLYFEESEGVISKCSLSPFARQLGLWLEKDDVLMSEKAVGFGVQKLSASVNIHEDGLYVEKGMSECKGQGDAGAIFWEQKSKKWQLCTTLGVETLEDKLEVELW